MAEEEQGRRADSASATVEPADAALLVAFAEGGDEDAFRRLVERHTGLVYGVARRRLGKGEWAEEVSQNVFTALARKAGAVAGAPSVAAWLHRATTLEALAFLRGQASRQRQLDLIRDHAEVEQSGADPWGPARAHLDEALQRLPARDRDVLLLHYLDGLTFKEVAGRVGTSAAAAQKRGVRAVGKLARLLRASGVAIPAATLGSGLSAEIQAAAPAGLAESLAAGALQATPATAAGATAATTISTTVMTSSKTAATLTFLAAAAFPIGWEVAAGPRPAPLVTTPEAGGGPGPESPTRAVVAGAAAGTEAVDGAGNRVGDLDLDELRRALQQLVAADGDDAATERALRRLMFSLDLEQVMAVTGILEEAARPPDRLYEVALALYARWAELEPAEAMGAAAALPPNVFGYYPLRGAFVTWAAIDWEAAVGWLTTATSAYDHQFLALEVLWGLAERDGRAAVDAAEQIGAAHPAWRDTLVRRAAARWTVAEPAAGLEWAAALADPVERDRFLGHVIEQLAAYDPAGAMDAVSRIENPPRRDEVMWNVFWGWINRSPGEAMAYFRRDGGIDNWPLQLLRGAGDGYARGNPAAAVALAREIDDPDRRNNYLGGVLTGALWTDPAKMGLAAPAVEMMAGERAGLGGLGSFVKAWAKHDPAAAARWIRELERPTLRRWAAGSFQGQTGRTPKGFLEEEEAER